MSSTKPKFSIWTHFQSNAKRAIALFGEAVVNNAYAAKGLNKNKIGTSNFLKLNTVLEKLLPRLATPAAPAVTNFSVKEITKLTIPNSAPVPIAKMSARIEGGQISTPVKPSPVAVNSSSAATPTKYQSAEPRLNHDDFRKLTPALQAKFCKDGGRISVAPTTSFQAVTAKYSSDILIRADFNNLSHKDRAHFCKSGGKITD